MAKVILVACASKKIESDVPVKAKDLYDSQLFKKSRVYGEQNSDIWYILSAEHHLLDPERKINGYNKTLNNFNPGERRQWAYNVLSELRTKLNKGDTVEFLSGARYCGILSIELEKLGFSVCIPMKGKRIGEQLKWLNEQISQ